MLTLNSFFWIGVLGDRSLHYLPWFSARFRRHHRICSSR